MRCLFILVVLVVSLFADPQRNFQMCTMCHGKYGEKAMGSKIAPQKLTKDQLSYALTKYRDNFQTSSGNAKIMSTNVRNFSDNDIEELSAFIKQVEARRQEEMGQAADEKIKNLY
ncbi:hypothetical protein FACS189487_01520 [Campylobacterota bacterium]|nr:hypothetical protein FACS189487_01520 [Campylobacterota bacterium]